MWGARTDKPPFVVQRMKRFSAGNADAGYGADQRFLAHEIWPAIRDDGLIHDSHYDLFNAQRFPVMGKGNDRFHVGMGIIGEDGNAQYERFPARRGAESAGRHASRFFEIIEE